jgi:hypothetical protein
MMAEVLVSPRGFRRPARSVLLGDCFLSLVLLRGDGLRPLEFTILPWTDALWLSPAVILIRMMGLTGFGLCPSLCLSQSSTWRERP